MSTRRWRSISVVLLAGAVATAAGACGGHETADHFREGIAARAADPAYELGQQLEDPLVSFHTGPDVNDAQFEAVHQAVLLTRVELEFHDPIDVFIGIDPVQLGFESTPDMAVVIDAATVAAAGSTDELHEAAARETALLAERARTQ